MWPIDSIVEKPANGYFLRDLLIFNGLDSGGFASKGFLFEPPDFNNALLTKGRYDESDMLVQIYTQ